jgi:mannitol/fructose-specific phosphotransferase system IIA component (Ntr-type)
VQSASKVTTGEHLAEQERSPFLGFLNPPSAAIHHRVVRGMSPTQTTEINQLLSPERIRIGLPGASKEAVIDALVDLLEGHEAIDHLESVRTAIFERENMMSTGVGKGLGLPHAKTSAATETVASFATTDAPIDFGAIDDTPVQLLLLLVGPEEHKSQHIKILGRISRLVSRDGFRERLLTAQTPEAIIDILREGEAVLRG